MENIVRVRTPKAVLFVLHGTTAPMDWEDRVIFPYVKEHLLPYLEANWNISKDILPLIDVMRRQSFDDHFVFETVEVPLIHDFNNTNSNWREALRTVNAYVMWQ